MQYNKKIIRIEVISDKTQKLLVFNQYRNKSLLASLSILLICFILSIPISKAILRPVNAIVNKIRSITSSNLHERVNIKWLPKELQVIKHSFNEVLERLEDSFIRVSQFSDDIAHEIRTPLNNLKGEIEVALQKKRTEKEYIELLHSNLEECHRLRKIIDNLTFLSRSEKKYCHFSRKSKYIQRIL